MPQRHRIPQVWLVSDKRNDARLEVSLRRLPRGSGFIFRHYHLSEPDRRTRFEKLKRIARARGHLVVLAGTPREASRWGASGYYCAPAKAGASPGKGGRAYDTRSLPSQGRSMSLMTAHSLRELGKANRARADAILLSPVHATRSHPQGRTLGAARFRLLAAHATKPVIALGGMDAQCARILRWKNWAAIDGI